MELRLVQGARMDARRDAMICSCVGCGRPAHWMVECGPTERRIICDEHKRERIEEAVHNIGHGDPETEAEVRAEMEITAHPLMEESLN